MTFGCSGVYRRLSVLCRGHTRACRRLVLVICNLDLLRTHVSLLSWRPDRKKEINKQKRALINTYISFGQLALEASEIGARVRVLIFDRE